MAQGDYAAAKPLLEQALAIHKAVLGERHPTTATSLDNLAALLDAQGDYAAAKPLVEQALAIFKATLGERHPDTVASLNNLAALLDAQGDYAAAKPLLEQALAIHKAVLGERHPTTATSMNNLAGLLYAQGDLAGAEPLLSRALEITRGNLELAAAAQAERQQLAMAQDLRSGLDAYLSLVQQAPLPAAAAYRYALAWKGSVFQRQRQARTARHALLEARDPELVRQLTALQDTTRQLATLALATPDPRHLPAWRQRIAELTAQGAVGRGIGRPKRRVPRPAAQDEASPAQVQAALPRDAALIDFLEYTQYRPTPPEQGGWKRERRLIAFVVRPARPLALLDLGAVPPIAAAVERWLATRGRRSAGGGPEDPAVELRRRIWQPLEPYLEGAQTVLVSPDGALGKLPLAALPGRQPGTYLIEERAIALVPVPQALAELLAGREGRGGPGPAAPDPGPSLLLVGDVDFGATPGDSDARIVSRVAARPRAGAWARFDPLPATRDEIRAVQHSFTQVEPGAPVLVLSRGQATEQALRQQAPRHRYLHLATHGFFSPAGVRSTLDPEPASPLGAPGPAPREIDPFGGRGIVGFHPGLLSGLALAGANRPLEPGQDDGILTALEVAEMDLSGVELTVLSACQTGLGATAEGRQAGGEGLLGLQRAFQVAGARGVVATFWDVDDEATRALMERFYENLWQKKLMRLEALRERSSGCCVGVGGANRPSRTPSRRS